MQQEEKPQSGAQQPPEQSSSAQAEHITNTKIEDEGSKEARGSSMDNEQRLEEDEETECGFCLFMKGGGCRESFTAWEKCVEDAEKNKEDVVEKCFQVTGALKKCMEAHADYYEPILRAEKAMEEEARQELDRERAAINDSEATSEDSLQKVSSSSAVEGKEFKQELNQKRGTANDPQATSKGPEQKGPSGSPEATSK